ncbi:MAG: organic hydroperoxide reductase OsmC/OhrA [Flavobacteriales bacterium]|jgi:organic hydroperoxide reductase OsmC/OhrA
MSEHKVYLRWNNKGEDFLYKTYDRSHLWEFEGGTLIKASAAADYLGKAELVNPEEAFAASLSSCHMLTFLAIASLKKYIVSTYEDNVVAILGKNEKRKMAVKTLYLRPNITFEGDNIPDNTTIDEMHHRAHQECFIANSVLTEIIVEPVY